MSSPKNYAIIPIIMENLASRPDLSGHEKRKDAIKKTKEELPDLTDEDIGAIIDVIFDVASGVYNIYQRGIFSKNCCRK